MSFKKTILFVIILAVLGGYYYFFEVRRTEQKQAAEQAEKKLFQFKADDVQDITLKRTDEEIILKKQDNAWKLTQPVNVLADKTAINRLITGLVNAERGRTIAEKAENDQDFGFDKPELVLTATVQGVEKPMHITIGSQTPTQSGYYARIGDAPAVLTISTSMKADLAQTLYALRDKTILDVDPAAIKQAVFSLTDATTGAVSTFTLTQTDNQWKITAPKEFKADAAKMASLLSAVKSASIKEFIAETPQDLSQYGLDKPATVLTLVVGEDNAQKTLLIGKTDEAKGGIYAKHQAADNVFLIPTTATAEFPKSLNDLREKTLLSYTTADVQKIELVSATETLTIEATPPATEGAATSWKITQPQPFSAATQKITNWLMDINSLKVEQFITDEPTDLKLYGLEPPQLHLSLWLKNQAQPQQLLIGNADAEKTGVYAKLGDQSSVVLLKAETFTQLNKTAFEMRDRDILALDTAAVEKVQLKYAATTLLLEKSGDTWKAKEPEKKNLLTYKVNNILYDLDALEFLEDIAAPDANLSVYGLTPPEVEITVWSKGQKDSLTVLVGAAVEGKTQRYVKLATGATVYAIAPTFLDELPKDLGALTEQSGQ